MTQEPKRNSMTMELYSLRDTKAGTYSFPIQAHNKLEALRTLGEAVNGSDTMVGKHPEDFQLFLLGNWDGFNGDFQTHPPEHVINCLELVKPEE